MRSLRQSVFPSDTPKCRVKTTLPGVETNVPSLRWCSLALSGDGWGVFGERGCVCVGGCSSYALEEALRVCVYREGVLTGEEGLRKAMEGVDPYMEVLVHDMEDVVLYMEVLGPNMGGVTLYREFVRPNMEDLAPYREALGLNIEDVVLYREVLGPNMEDIALYKEAVGPDMGNVILYMEVVGPNMEDVVLYMVSSGIKYGGYSPIQRGCGTKHGECGLI